MTRLIYFSLRESYKHEGSKIGQWLDLETTEFEDSPIKRHPSNNRQSWWITRDFLSRGSVLQPLQYHRTYGLWNSGFSTDLLMLNGCRWRHQRLQIQMKPYLNPLDSYSTIGVRWRVHVGNPLPFFPPGSQFMEPYKLGASTQLVQSPFFFLEWYSPGPLEDSMAESQDMRTRRHHRKVHLFMSTLSPMRNLWVTTKPLSIFPHKEDALSLPFASLT